MGAGCAGVLVGGHLVVDGVAGPAFIEDSPTINAKAHGYSPDCPGYDRLDWDVKALVDSAGSTLTLGMRSSDDSDNDEWRKFDNDPTLNYPLLTVVYNSYPNTPGVPELVGATGTGPSPYWTQDATPTLRAVVSDPDGTAGGLVRGRFEVYAGSTLVASGDGSSTSSGASPGSSWTVPSGELTAGVLYTVRVWGVDDQGLKSASWSDSIQFRVDLTPPASPVVSAPADIDIGHSATFTVSSSSSDVVRHCYGVKTGTTPTCVSTTTPTTPLTVTTASVTAAGPAWITVVSQDASGRQSLTPTVVWFEVRAVAANHIWNLDNSGADAVTTGPIPLTASGGATYVAGDAGGTDRALSFNGTTASALGSGPAVTTSGSFSVAARVYLPGAVTGTRTAVAQQASSYAPFSLGVIDGYPAFTIRGADASSPSVVASSPYLLPVGEWVHLAAVYSSVDDRVWFYVNGQLEATQPVAFTATSASGAVVVGRSQAAAAPAQYWSGSVDEVRTFPGVIGQNTVLQQWLAQG